MATIILDLDGTIVKHGTDDLLPGAEQLLRDIAAAKHSVVFTTRRGDDFPIGHVYHRMSALRLIKSLKEQYGLKVLETIYNCDSPRILINDDGCHAHCHKTDAPLNYNIGDLLTKCEQGD